MSDSSATSATETPVAPAAAPATGAVATGAPATAATATPGASATATPVSTSAAAGHAAASAHAPAPAAKKKSAGSGLGGTIAEVLGGLKSPDNPTRNGAILFVASLCGIVLVLGLAAVHLWQVHKDHHAEASQSETGKNLDEFIKKQAEEAKKPYSTQVLGTFTIQLKPLEGQKAAPGVMGLAEIELQAKCDEKETCEALEAGSAQIRNEITSSLEPMDRDELISKEGKNRIKKKVLDRINAWLPKGKVEDIYFSKFVID